MQRALSPTALVCIAVALAAGTVLQRIEPAGLRFYTPTNWCTDPVIHPFGFGFLGVLCIVGAVVLLALVGLGLARAVLGPPVATSRRIGWAGRLATILVWMAIAAASTPLIESALPLQSHEQCARQQR